MKFLVTGGAGYIGSHMAHLLIDLGHQVTILDDLSTGHRELMPPQAEFVQGDMGDSKLVPKLLADLKPDAVFHFAAFIRVEESVSDPSKYYLNNTAKAASLIKFCCEQQVPRFIFSSTAAVYGTPATETVTEDSPLKPESPYGHSKAMTEQILRDSCSASSMKFAILRYFNVAGARPDMKSGQISQNATHLIKIAAETALGKRKQMSIYGDDYPTADGTCVRDYIHVQDLVKAHWRAFEYLQTPQPSGVFNLGYGRGFSVKEVLKEFESTNSVKIPHTMGPRRAGDAVRIVANSEKAKNILAWKPEHDSLAEICKTAYQWEKTLS